MLDLTNIDLGDLSEALEDHSYEHSWWLDPETGEVLLWSDYFEEEGEPDPEMRGLRAIDPIPSNEAYEDMEDFIERVRGPAGSQPARAGDRRARRLSPLQGHPSRFPGAA